MIASMLGHALIASEDPEESRRGQAGAQARRSNRDNDNPFAWYQLGIVYDREGDQPRAALATAERSNLEGKTKLALASAKMAMAGFRRERPTIFARRISPWCPKPS